MHRIYQVMLANGRSKCELAYVPSVKHVAATATQQREMQEEAIMIEGTVN